MLNTYPKIKNTPYLLLLLSFCLVFLYACDESKPESASFEGTTKMGIKYKFLARKGKEARKIKTGDLLTFHLMIKNHKDSIIRNTYKDASGVIKQIPFQDPYIPRYFKEVFAMMAEGDSLNVWIKADSLMQKGQVMPPFLKQGTDLLHTIKLVKVQTQDEVKKENDALAEKMKKEAEKYKATNDQELTEYMKTKSLKAEKTASGLYYIIEKQGAGRQPKNGDKVSVHYTGYTLDGNKFDSSTERGQPIEFLIGRNMVIPGWDEGIALLKEGAKAKLLIPSHLAYGGQGAGGVIKPYACLVFDVELVKAEAAPTENKQENKEVK